MRKVLMSICALAVLGLATAPVATAGVPKVAKKAEMTLGGGNVMPAVAQPKGYSLYDLARITAPFNVTDHSGAQPKIPFQMLFYRENLTFQVRPGTMLYVPIMYNDNSPPVVGDFPDPTDRAALLHYWYSQEQFGVVDTTITVDGVPVSLGPDYLVGMTFATPLPDTATGYMTVGVVLTPLTKGTHTVEISFMATGEAVGGEWGFTLPYTVVVR